MRRLPDGFGDEVRERDAGRALERLRGGAGAPGRAHRGRGEGEAGAGGAPARPAEPARAFLREGRSAGAEAVGDSTSWEYTIVSNTLI